MTLRHLVLLMRYMFRFIAVIAKLVDKEARVINCKFRSTQISFRLVGISSGFTSNSEIAEPRNFGLLFSKISNNYQCVRRNLPGEEPKQLR